MNDHIQKMHQARRDARDEAIWESVSQSMETNHCKCDLRKGMTQEDLRGIVGCCHPRYICPSLDTYRRLLPATPIPDEELALQEGAA